MVRSELESPSIDRATSVELYISVQFIYLPTLNIQYSEQLPDKYDHRWRSSNLMKLKSNGEIYVLTFSLSKNDFILTG